MPTIKYRKESDGKFHVDIDDSGRYGIQFSTRKAMRHAIQRKYKLKEVEKM